jgi:hypothetical protein
MVTEAIRNLRIHCRNDLKCRLVTMVTAKHNKVTDILSSEWEEEFEGSQSCQRVKYTHENRGTRNQESPCWRGPTKVQQSVIE